MGFARDFFLFFAFLTKKIGKKGSGCISLSPSPIGCHTWLHNTLGTRPKEWSPTTFCASDTIQSFCQFPPKTPFREASQALDESSADQWHNADRVPVDPLQR